MSLAVGPGACFDSAPSAYHVIDPLFDVINTIVPIADIAADTAIIAYRATNTIYQRRYCLILNFDSDIIPAGN